MTKRWKPPVETTLAEERILRRCSKRKIFVFLRRYRHLLFDEPFQEQLWSMYSERERGRSRVHPATLCMATLLQAALDVPDHEAVELTLDSARWRMVLDFHGEHAPAFSQGTLFNFRERLIKHDMDQVLLQRTVDVARQTRGFSSTRLRAAFDASPLWGAGRVEDTFNLIGRALGQVVRTAASRHGISVEELAKQAGAPVVMSSSTKAGLDLDWDDPNARSAGLRLLLGQVSAVEQWLQKEMQEALREPPLSDQWETLQRLIEQDTEPDPEGSGTERRVSRGVAKDRQVSLSDKDRRHGRKSKSKLFNGYKRHVAVDLDLPGLVVAVEVTAANAPERVAAKPLLETLEKDGKKLEVLAIDRGYLGAQEVLDRERQGTRVLCKPFPLRNGGRFTKKDFKLDFVTGTVTCPAGNSRPMEPGHTVRFGRADCDECTVREQCTRAAPGRGRCLTIHPAELFHEELRKRVKTQEGRHELRERVAVEHALARVGQRQGTRARYRGLRKNLFDLRRHAAVNNLDLLGTGLAAAA